MITRLRRLCWWFLLRTEKRTPTTLVSGYPSHSPGRPAPAPTAPRVFFGWFWNSPQFKDNSGYSIAPYFTLQIDDLTIGKKVSWTLPPGQVRAFCEYGLDALRSQAGEFRYSPEQPPDYDVRGLTVIAWGPLDDHPS